MMQFLSMGRKKEITKPCKIYGYEKVYTSKNNFIIRICETEAAIIREIYQRYTDGETVREIAEALKLENLKSRTKKSLSPQFITKLFSRAYSSRYKGCDPIITSPNYPVFHATIDLRSQGSYLYKLRNDIRKHRVTRQQKSNLLSAILLCRECSTYYYSKNIKNIRYYVHTGKRDDLCSPSTVHIDKIDAVVLDQLKRIVCQMSDLNLNNHKSRESFISFLSHTSPIWLLLFDEYDTFNKYFPSKPFTSQFSRKLYIQLFELFNEATSESIDWYVENATHLNDHNTLMQRYVIKTLYKEVTFDRTYVYLLRFGKKYYKRLQYKFTQSELNELKEHDAYKQLWTSLSSPSKQRLSISQLSMLQDYLKQKVPHYIQSLKHEMITTINSTLQKMDTQKSLSLFPFPQSEYTCIENTSSTLVYPEPKQDMSHIFFSEASFKPFILFGKNEILAIPEGKHTFLNRKFLHFLPEWFYGPNNEYFMVNRKKYIFVEEDTSIIAYQVGRNGDRERMNAMEVIKLINSDPKAKWVDFAT